MSFHYRYRKQIIIGVLLLIIIGAITGGSIYYLNNKKEPQKEAVTLKKKEIKKEKEVEEVVLYQVDIKGEIRSPGIYQIKENSRVMDVINMAGGLTENANTTVINLSKKVSDEMVIIIYSNQEVEDFKKTKELETQVQSSCIQKEENAVKNDACIEIDNYQDGQVLGKININTATLEQLTALPGVGESKAKSIIEYRNTNGNFNSIEDIKNVTGIGDSLFDKIKDYITT